MTTHDKLPPNDDDTDDTDEDREGTVVCDDHHDVDDND